MNENNSPENQETTTTPDPSCESCEKPNELCVCDQIKPFNTRLHVLILQHPQEPDKELGSALLAHRSPSNSTLRIGLSWPNLKAALSSPTVGTITPSRWLVLYLGSGIKQAELTPTSSHKSSRESENSLNSDASSLTQTLRTPEIFVVNKNGAVLERLRSDASLGSKSVSLPYELVGRKKPTGQKSELDGIVILDGTWSQAKALWWRNPWLLKLRRGILKPSRKSLYRELRKEPRGECLSTIESIAEALEALGEPISISEQLRSVFSSLLDRQRERLRAKSSTPTSSSGSESNSSGGNEPQNRDRRRNRNRNRNRKKRSNP